MRILMLIDGMETGGAETHVEELSRSLAQLGADVTVASSGGAVARRLAKFGVRHIPIPSVLLPKNDPELRAVASLPLRLAAARKAIAEIIAGERPDVVHSHTRRMAFVANPVCARLKIAHIVTAHAMFSMRFPRGALSCWGNGVIAVSEDIRDRLFEPYDGEIYTIRHKSFAPHRGLSAPKPQNSLQECENRSRRCENSRQRIGNVCLRLGISPLHFGARRTPLRVRVIRNGVRITPPTTREN